MVEIIDAFDKLLTNHKDVFAPVIKNLSLAICFVILPSSIAFLLASGHIGKLIDRLFFKQSNPE